MSDERVRTQYIPCGTAGAGRREKIEVEGRLPEAMRGASSSGGSWSGVGVRDGWAAVDDGALGVSMHGRYTMKQTMPFVTEREST